MAKNMINFTKMTAEGKTQIVAFNTSALKIAQEDLRYKAEVKPLKAEREKILENRDNDIKAGIPADEVIAKFSTVEVDNKLRKAEAEHNEKIKPLNETMKDTYKFIPEGIYEAYVKKIDEGKRGDFLNEIKTFLTNLGIDKTTVQQLSKFAEGMSDKLGAKYATSKKIVNDGVLVTAMKKNQFNKLFMAVFCDTYITAELIEEWTK